MPRISYFFGITIAMFFSDHPTPHFHAEYAGMEASIAIGSLDLIAGSLPPAQVRKVRKWAALHRAELQENWDRARRGEPLKQIKPLR